MDEMAFEIERFAIQQMLARMVEMKLEKLLLRLSDRARTSRSRVHPYRVPIIHDRKRQRQIVQRERAGIGLDLARQIDGCLSKAKLAGLEVGRQLAPMFRPRIALIRPMRLGVGSVTARLVTIFFRVRPAGGETICTAICRHAKKVRLAPLCGLSFAWLPSLTVPLRNQLRSPTRRGAQNTSSPSRTMLAYMARPANRPSATTSSSVTWASISARSASPASRRSAMTRFSP